MCLNSLSNIARVYFAPNGAPIDLLAMGYKYLAPKWSEEENHSGHWAESRIHQVILHMIETNVGSRLSCV